MFENIKKKCCGWFESPDGSGKAPLHQQAAIRNKYKNDRPATVCFEEPPKKKGKKEDEYDKHKEESIDDEKDKKVYKEESEEPVENGEDAEDD
ncbi:MAG TPA: hypothetical protein VN368_00670 [Candidatus Methylomirabilis sp.]|nr:hypothetical protein [Candidatus Methylomirabilis sp.]